MELHKPKNLYELLTLNMEQRFANRVAFRWYDADQDVVVEKHFGEYAQDIRRAVNYYLSTIPDIQGKRVCVWSNNSYHYAVNCYGVMMAGGVIVPMNQRKSWDELHRELELVEPSAILTDGDDYGCNEEMQAAYGSLLRPMDAYKAYEPAELVNRIQPEELMELIVSDEMDDFGAGLDPQPASMDSLGEFDFYRWSGWMYSYNGRYPGYSMSACKPQDGAEIRLRFTLALGKDIGGFNADAGVYGASSGNYYREW